MINSDEIDFNLYDAIKYLLNRLFSIFIVGIIVAVVFCVSTVFNSSKNNVDSATIKEIESKIKDNDTRLENCVHSLELQKENIDKSHIMNINANSVYSYSMQFYIDCNLERINDITTVFSNYSSNGGLANDIYKKDATLETEYIKEIVEIYCSNYGTYNDAAVINVKVIGKDEEMCRKYASYAKEAIYEFSSNISENVNEHKLEMIQEMSYVGRDNNILAIQNNAYSSLENIEKNIDVITDNIAQYRNTIRNEFNMTFLMKKTILCGFIGFVIIIIFYLLKYIANTNIKYSEEVALRTGLLCFGDCEVYKRTWTSRILKKVRNKEKNKDLLTFVRIYKECKDSQYNNIAIIGKFDEENISPLELICQNLKNKGIMASMIGNIVNDSEAIEKFDKTIPSIVVISGKNTTYLDYNQLIQLCNYKNVNILGYIFMK